MKTSRASAGSTGAAPTATARGTLAHERGGTPTPDSPASAAPPRKREFTNEIPNLTVQLRATSPDRTVPEVEWDRTGQVRARPASATPRRLASQGGLRTTTMTARRTEAYARYEAGTVHWGECDAIERDPARMEGVWRFTGTAVAVADLFHGLAGGINTRDFVKQHEGVAENGPRSVLEFIADQLDDAKDAIWEHGGPREATPPRLKGGACNRGRDDDPQTTHWKECGNASRDSERMTGSWCLEDLRFPLSTLFANLAAAGSVEGLVDVFTLTRNEVLPVLRFLTAELGNRATPASRRRTGNAPENRRIEATRRRRRGGPTEQAPQQQEYTPGEHKTHRFSGPQPT